MSTNAIFPAALAVAAIMSCAAPAAAASLDAPITFNIPAQALDTAILAYSRQSGLQVVSSAPLLDRKSTAGVQGVRTPAQALKELLRTSNLTFTVAGQQTITILPAPPVDARALVRAAPAPRPVEEVAAPALSQSLLASTGLAEVVVTATRRTDTVNRVAMSVTALTQRALDLEGLKSALDLTRGVTSLVLLNQTAGVGSFAIRGIVSTVGAPTTGVYLDDTSLTKRANAGASQNNGSPIPILFDLERIEVLKGPQGTLYGSSSEGGTIRFITPAPSLTTYSGFARAEVSQVETGSPSSEFGLALGGPIVADKLGVRLSGVIRNTGGWIDAADPYHPGKLYDKDANARREQAVRGALRWQITGRASADLSLYHSYYLNNGGPDSTTVVYGPNGQPAPAGQTFTTPATCYDNSARAANSATSPAATPCQAVLPAGYFRRPAATYGPYNLQKDQSVALYPGVLTRGDTSDDIAALTLAYGYDHLIIKSITSLIRDHTTGNADEGYDILRLQTTVENPGKINFPLFSADPTYPGDFVSNNWRSGVEQEIRLASPADQRPFSWVAGVYASALKTHINYRVRGDYTAPYLAFYGLTAQQRYGGQVQSEPGTMSTLDAHLNDTELAAFGEASYWLGDKLKLTAGLRYSQTRLNFDQANYGQYLPNRPTITSPGAFIQGTVRGNPLTPKFAAQYQFTRNDMVYVSIAKGFRPGGLNAPLNPAACGPGLAIYGLTVNDIPSTYGEDTVWSYEAGGKFRMLDNRIQLNASVFQIDWSQIQVTQTAPSCPGWNQNGGNASSRGFDLEADYRPAAPVLIRFTLGYTDARYTQTVNGPTSNTGVQAIAFNAGDPLGVPNWQGVLSSRYDFLLGRLPAYVRGDFQYQGPYLQGSSYGAVNYIAATRHVGELDTLNVRAGVFHGNWELNLFSNNVLGSRQEIGNGGNGQSGCTVAGGPGCTAYGVYQPFVIKFYQKPRVVGLQTNYRF